MTDKSQLPKQDAILWKANYLKAEAGESIQKKADAIDKICRTLSLVRNDVVRDNYTKTVSKTFNEKIKFFTDRVQNNLKAIEESKTTDEELEETNIRYPSYFTADNKSEVIKKGFTQTYEAGSIMKTGIYYLTKEGVVCVSNFTITPLFHVVSPELSQNKKTFLFRNAFEQEALDVEAAATLSVERFSAIINAKNNFMFHGNSMQLKRIMEHLGYGVERCEEVKILGWQPEGFFAYTDKFISNGDLKELNQYGIGEHNQRKYFSPSQSVLYKNNRSDDNIYESLKYLNFKQSPVNFEKWSKLMTDAYGLNGQYAVAYVFVACFRDLVLRIDGVCPHFYVWGAPGSGKSKMMESLSSLFFSEKRSFAANSGTDFGLSRFLEIFRNTFHFINELDEQDIKPQWLQWFKGAYDNEGRQRGKGGSKNMTETMNVNSVLGLAGQKIVNSDDNALPMRCIIRNFKTTEDKDRPKIQTEAYNTLKEMESNGGFNSLLVDIFGLREEFKKDYHPTFSEIFVEAHKEIKKRNLRWNERIGRNYCYLLAGVKIASQHFALPFKYQDLYDDVIQEIHHITRLITGTDATSEFWRIVMSLADQNKVVAGWHYRIDVKYGPLDLYGGKQYTILEPTRILFIRISHIHTLYKLAYRSETGKEGMNISSLTSYFENRPYYIGVNNKMRFTGKDPHTGVERSSSTSCLVFNYDMMEQAGIELQQELATAVKADNNQINLDAMIEGQKQDVDLPF